MLRPTKYTNVDSSLIGVSADVLKYLKQENAQKFNQLYRRIKFKKGEEINKTFFMSLIFLFLVGKIKYYINSDVIELQK